MVMQKSQATFQDTFHKSSKERSLLRPEKIIDGREWVRGDRVICKRRDHEFKAEIIGFYENSALVRQNNYEIRCMNLRNMYDPKTNTAVRATSKEEAISVSKAWQTAYLPTPQEVKEWSK